MKSIPALLGCLSVLSVLAAIALHLTGQFGLVIGCAIYASITTSMTLLAGWLLHGSEAGEITWKNRTAGILLPWSMWIGSGSPTWFLVTNAIASILFGCLIVICNPWNSIIHQGTNTHGDGGEENGWMNLLVSGSTALCWIVLLGAWLRLLQNRGAKNSWQSLAIPPLAVGISLCMRYYGMPVLALIVVALPIALVLLPVALMIGGMLVGHLTGKPIRWN